MPDHIDDRRDSLRILTPDGRLFSGQANDHERYTTQPYGYKPETRYLLIAVENLVNGYTSMTGRGTYGATLEDLFGKFVDLIVDHSGVDPDGKTFTVISPEGRVFRVEVRQFPDFLDPECPLRFWADVIESVSLGTKSWTRAYLPGSDTATDALKLGVAFILSHINGE
jgi:hypothetical protein